MGLPLNIQSASGGSQVIGPMYNPNGLSGTPVPALIVTNTAILVELRVISALLNATGVDLNTLRADELSNVVLPGNL